MKPTLPLVFLLFHPSLTFAAKGAPIVIPCADGSSMETDDQTCDDNHVFSKAGQTCLDALEAAVKSQSGAVALAMNASNAAHVGGGANAQNTNFSGSAANYALSQATLAELIQAAKVARATTADLENHIYYPEDFDAPEEVIGDPITFIDSQDCYNDARTGLEKTLAKMDADIADLKKGQSASAVKDNTSAGRQNITKSVDPGSTALPPNPSASGKVQPKGSGFTPYHPSDISGTDEPH